MAYRKASKMIEDTHNMFYSDWYAANSSNVGPPTYHGHQPFIGGMPPQPPTFYPGPLPHPLNNIHALSNRLPSSPESPPERPTT